MAAGGEGIRRLSWDYVDLRHRNTDFLREAFDGCVGARWLLAGHGLGPGHGQRDLVGIEVRDEVHDGGEHWRQEHSVLTAEGAANKHQQQRERGQQECGLECISHNLGETILLDVLETATMHKVESWKIECIRELPGAPLSLKH